MTSTTIYYISTKDVVSLYFDFIKSIDAYIIQETGLYKITHETRIIYTDKKTQCGIAIKRNGTITFAIMGGETWLSSSHNSIIYPCLQNDEVSVRTTHFTIFDERTPVYGSASSNGALNTYPHGIKIG